MPIKLANNASGTLATAISASDTGIALTTGDGAKFPALGAGEYFYATLVSSQGTQEIVKATARSGDSLTVVRAQEGTTAAGFAAGSRFELRVTAQSVIDAINDRSEDLINNFTGNGLTTTFTLTFAPINENYTSIYINGVYQNKNTYSISGAVITFSQAPPNTSVIEVSF